VSDAPIGVFDSGIGGLSVYAEIRRLLPSQDVVYVADQGFGSYGERSISEVRQRSEQIADWLIGEGARAVVVACNSASAAALQHLRKRRPAVAFIGMEPAVKPAIEISNTGIIGVLATEATFQGELFASLLDRYAADHEVITQACPGLAAAIEDDDLEFDDLIGRYVGNVVGRGADVVVLGCTHYSLIDDRIGAVARPARVVDPAPAVARRVARLIDDAGTGAISFLTTGDPARFAEQVSRLGFDPAGVGSVAV
jgi:glutamate racemase